MSVWLRNRRTGNIFRTRRTARQGRYADEITWLRNHGYAHFAETVTADGYILETWVDALGNVVNFKVERPSGTPMQDATIVEARYVPARE